MLLNIILISFAILTDSSVADNEHGNEQRALCTTNECQEFARAIKANMDTSVDPCVDFYQYACGNWENNHPIEPGTSSLTVLIIAAQEHKRKIEEMLKSPSQDDEIPPVKIVKQWYKVCIDKDRIDRRGMEPLINILSGIGGWPIIMEPHEWNENSYKWQDIDDYYARMRGSNLLHEVRVDDANSTGPNVVLDVPALPPATWLLNTEMEVEENETSKKESNEGDERIVSKKKFKKDGEYWKFITSIVAELVRRRGVTIPIKKLYEDMEDILNFQWKLENLTKLTKDHENMTVKSFQDWYNNLGLQTEKSKVNWAGKIINIFKDANIDVDIDNNLTVASPKYFKELASVLDQTSTRIIVNYLHWNFVSSTISKTTDEMRRLFEKTTEKQKKLTVIYSGLDDCVEEAKMNDVIAYEFIQKFFSNSTRKTAFDLVHSIEKEIEILIGRSNWADDDLKSSVLRKLRNVKKHIAYPDWYNNATFMRHYLDGLTIGSEYFENSLTLSRYYTLKELRRLKYKNDTVPWIIDPLTLNAVYSNEDNSITINVPNLQKPFFNDARPDTVNYALTGFFFGHELYHPFDYLRHIFGEDGKHGEEIHWSPPMTEKYNEGVQCFIEQYNNYTLNGRPSGPTVEDYGNQTLEENMSDTMGLQAAFKAFKKKEKINGKPFATLPGLEMFNNSQIFFLSFANLWCEYLEPYLLLWIANLQLHSVGRLRTIGSLSNNEDFAETFSCPLGSPMNPEKKCNIWKL